MEDLPPPNPNETPNPSANPFAAPDQGGGTPPPPPPPAPAATPEPDDSEQHKFIHPNELEPLSYDPKDIPDQPILPSSLKQNKDTGWHNAESEKESFKIIHETDSDNYGPKSLHAIATIAAGLEDDDCTQIDSYGHNRFSAQFKGKQTAMVGVEFENHEEYTDWLRSIVNDANRLVDWETIENDAQGTLALPGGQRLQIFMPPITSEIVFSLRKHTASSWPNEKFVELGMLDQRILHFLQACIASHTNVLFVGPMGSGKSSLLRALISSSVGDDEKLSVLESIPELALEKQLVIPMLYQESIEQMKLEKVLDSNLYFGVSRLIVGEVHMEGLAKMLETMILTEGSMSTYHASSAELAAERMKIALQMEYGNLNEATAAAYIRNALELVVVVKNIKGTRRVTQIREIDWRKSSGDEVLGGRDLFQFDQENNRFRAVSRMDENGRIVEKLANKGIELPDEWFIEPDTLKKYMK